MKVYRFAIHPEEDGYFFLECINDPHLFTQARSMDDALYMARDVVETLYEEKNFIVEFVVPPDIMTRYEQKQRAAAARRMQKKSPRRVAATNGRKPARAA